MSQEITSKTYIRSDLAPTGGAIVDYVARLFRSVASRAPSLSRCGLAAGASYRDRLVIGVQAARFGARGRAHQPLERYRDAVVKRATTARIRRPESDGQFRKVLPTMPVRGAGERRAYSDAPGGVCGDNQFSGTVATSNSSESLLRVQLSTIGHDRSLEKGRASTSARESPLRTSVASADSG